MSKKKEVRQEIHHPPTEEFPEGRIEEVFWDGTSRFIDKSGNPILPAIPNEQLEAWKKAPKEQALKEALELFRSQGMDVAEQRVKLEIIKFIAELQNAIQPAKQQGANVVAIRVNFVGAEQPKIEQRSVDVEARVIEQ